MILFGGRNRTSPNAETWELRPCTPASLTTQPTPTAACTTGQATFSIAASGTNPITAQWQIETAPNVWLNATNGTLPYSPGTITATGVTSENLHLSLNVPPTAPPVRFRCVITNSCGSPTSDTATLTICPADFNCDGFANGDDYDLYVEAFATGDPLADFNQDGFVTGDDFDAYVLAFEAGC